MEEVPSSPPLFCVLRNSPYLFPSRGVLPGGACKSRVTKMDAPGTREPRGFLLRIPATTVVLEEPLEVVGSTPQRTTTPLNADTSEASILRRILRRLGLGLLRGLSLRDGTGVEVRPIRHLINLSTRLRVSLGDNSQSSPHLSNERSVGDIDGGSGASNLRGLNPQKSPSRQDFH